MYSAMRKKKGLSCRELAEQMKAEFPVMPFAQYVQPRIGEKRKEKKKGMGD